MKVDRRVEGVVRDPDGLPVSGGLVEMASTESKIERWMQPAIPTISDESGHYAIDGIPPGEYYLGVNILSTPTKEQPYPKLYYPNTPDLKMAVPIRVQQSASVQEFNLQIRPRLPLIKLHGRIQTKAGKPPLTAFQSEVRIKEPGLYGQIEELPIEVDANGLFTIELCDGITYSAFAFAGPIRSQVYSVPIEFTPGKDNDELVLTLDKTQTEFLKLRHK